MLTGRVPTFLLLLGRRAAGGLVAGLLSHWDGRDDAGLAAQPPLLLLLLQVLQDVLGPLVGARHRPRREGFLAEKGKGKRENKKRTNSPVEKLWQEVASSRISATDLRNMTPWKMTGRVNTVSLLQQVLVRSSDGAAEHQGLSKEALHRARYHR